jgi:hypothetical protein
MFMSEEFDNSRCELRISEVLTELKVFDGRLELRHSYYSADHLLFVSSTTAELLPTNVEVNLCFSPNTLQDLPFMS